MEISRSSLILLIALTVLYFEPTVERRVVSDGKNFGFLERISCRIYSPQMISNVTCRIKYIDRNNVRMLIAVHVRRPVTAAWIHGVGYYKYNFYQKIATEYWDDGCAWLGGEGRSFILDFMKPVLLKYSNFNHSCPYTGHVFVKADNVSLQKFMIPQIMPAGRYKVDLNVTEGIRKRPLVGFTVYGSISDHRIEMV